MRKKRNKLKKQHKRFFRKILIFLLILIVFALFALGIYYIFGDKINNIYIYDNNVLSDQEIIESAKLEKYPSFYLTPSSTIEKNLEKNYFVKKAEVKKKFFKEVHIYIEEYKILFFREDTSKLVLESGKEIKTDKAYLNVPTLINYVPDTVYAKLIKKISDIDDNILKKVSEIKYDPNQYDEDRFLLYMNDDNYVYVTLTKFKLLNKYNSTVEKLEGKKGILYLDSGNYFKIIK